MFGTLHFQSVMQTLDDSSEPHSLLFSQVESFRVGQVPVLRIGKWSQERKWVGFFRRMLPISLQPGIHIHLVLIDSGTLWYLYCIGFFLVEAKAEAGCDLLHPI